LRKVDLGQSAAIMDSLTAGFGQAALLGANRGHTELPCAAQEK
jgi:hypothetical protein